MLVELESISILIFLAYFILTRVEVEVEVAYL
jgi:hypothetical protein